MAHTCSICRSRTLCIAAALLLSVVPARGDSHLLFLEGQGIAGYSSQKGKPVYYSMNGDAEMQKPSIGFDYLHRFSAKTGDWGAFGLQGRLALTVDDNVTQPEPQVYNAWFKVKTPVTDAWIGHNRPAMGLGSFFDSHALIMRTLPIQGFGYDRDWGGGPIGISPGETCSSPQPPDRGCRSTSRGTTWWPAG